MSSKTKRKRVRFVAALSVFLALTVALGAVFLGVGALAGEESFENVRARKLAEYDLYGFLAPSGAQMPYRTTVNRNMSDEQSRALIDSWQRVNFNISNAGDSSSLRVAFCEAYLSDVLFGAFEPIRHNSTSDKDVLAMSAGLLNYVSAQAGSNPAEYAVRGFSGMDESERRTLENALRSSGELGATFTEIQSLDSLGEFNVTVSVLLNTLSKIETLLRLEDSYASILAQAGQSITDSDLSQACSDLAARLDTSSVPGQGGFASSLVLGKWGSSMSELGNDYAAYIRNLIAAELQSKGIGAPMNSGYGKFRANIFFSSDQNSENLHELYALSMLEDALKASLDQEAAYINGSYLNSVQSRRYNACYELLHSVYDLGVGITLSFSYQARGSGYFISVAEDNSGGIAEYQTRLSTTKQNMIQLEANIHGEAYNQFCQLCGNAAVVMGMTTESTMTAENAEELFREVHDCLLSLGDVSLTSDYMLYNSRRILGDLNISQNVTTSQSMTFAGKATCSDGTIDLSGTTLIIQGALEQTGGTVKVNGGKLVAGGYSMTGNSILNMTDAADRVIVNGDFTASSTAEHSQKLTNGVLTLRGDLTQLSDEGGSTYNLNCTIDHKIIFDGNKTQTVSFDSTGSGFASVEFRNDDIIFAKNKMIRGFALSADTLLRNDIDLNVSGNIDLSGYTLETAGNLNQISGGMKINNGKLIVDGDYTLDGSAALVMTNADDEVTVNGDLTVRTGIDHVQKLTNGVMTLCGDLTQEDTGNSYNFYSSDFHTISLEGEERQTVSFQSGNSGIANLKITNSHVSFAGVNRIGNLISEVVIDNDLMLNIPAATTTNLCGNTFTVNGSLALSGSGTFDLSAGTLNINGDLVQTDNNLKVNSGKVNIDGDYSMKGKSALYMTNADDRVTVNGDLTASSTVEHSQKLTNGVLTLKGDLTQLSDEGGNTYNLNCTINHKLVFAGSGRQNISFDSTNSGFASVEFQNDDIIFAKDKMVRGFTLSGDTVFKNDFDMNISGALDLAGHSLTVGGDLNQTKGKMSVNNGSLTVNGDYTINGDSTLFMINACDAVKVDGDLTMNSSVEHYQKLTNGVLTLKGDLTQLGADSGRGYNLSCGGDHTVVLDGDELQTVSFQSGNSGIANLEIRNTHVSFEGVTKIGRLVADARIENDLALNIPSGSTMSLEGHRLSVNGNFTLSGGGTLDLQGGNLDMSGNLVQTGCGLKVNGGMVYVDGDCNMSGNSALYMTNADDRVTVNGDLTASSTVEHSQKLTNGVLTLKGDLIQLGDEGGSTYNLNCTSNHKLVFAGSGRQNISFDSTNSGFASVEFQNDDIIFAKDKMVRGFSLSGDTVFKNDFDMNISGTLDLAGHSLTVGGDLNQTKGKMSVNNGSLTVNGDYTINGDSTLFMVNADDTVTVNGDFTMSSDTDHSQKLTNGVMTLKGDLIQENNSYNFNCGGSHRIALDGDKTQRVRITSSNSCIRELEIRNTHVLFEGVSRIESLVADAEIDNDLTLNIPNGSRINLGGHRLEVNGNLYISGDGTLDIQGGALEVRGNIIQTGSSLKPDGGTVDVGSYIMSGASYLYMTDEHDRVNVNGSLVSSSTGEHAQKLTNGVLTLKGDLIQNGADSGSSYNLSFSGDHRIVFAGEGQQRISFDSTNSGFAAVEFQNDDILFDPEKTVRGFSLSGDTVFKNDFDMNISGALDLVGHSLTVGGDLNQTKGRMRVNNGSLTVNGDYKLTGNTILEMKNGGEAVTVNGSFTMASDTSHVNALSNGVLTVRGNFSQEEKSNGYNFYADGEHRTVLDGDKPQIVSFESGNSTFNTLTLTQDMSQYTFIPAVRCRNLELVTEVYEINILADRYTVAPCVPLYFGWQLRGVNLSEEPVIWSIESEVSEETSISESGVLTVAPGEEAQTITVRATSVDDPEKYAETEITVSRALAGDVDLNGVVDVDDVTALQKHLAKLISFTDEQCAVADTDGDGIITIIDATRVQKLIAGLIEAI